VRAFVRNETKHRKRDVIILGIPIIFTSLINIKKLLNITLFTVNGK